MRPIIIALLLLLSACASRMTHAEFAQMNMQCDQTNPTLEQQVTCLNDKLMFRNQTSQDIDVYYAWVKERNIIVDRNKRGELKLNQAKQALLDAETKYGRVLWQRDMLNAAYMDAFERSRPHFCHSRPTSGGGFSTFCD